MNEYTKPIIKCKVVDAFDKYIKNITSKKCIKNQRNEKRYFAALVKHIDVEYICDVKAYHIENYIAASLRDIKASSVERRLATIRHFFNLCLEWEYILTNPMVKLKKLKIEKNHFKTLSEIEYKNFIELCDGDYLNIIKFMHLTGARPSEVFSLRWLDIDYTEMIIKLRCGKNANIARDFPLTKKLEKLFHKME